MHRIACNSMSASLLQVVAQLLASGHYGDVAPQLDAIELRVRMALKATNADVSLLFLTLVVCADSRPSRS